jgi:hypothetical protein
MGGIYTLGVSTGTRLRYNLIHDVECLRYGGWGIYPDEGTTDLLAERNVVYRCSSAPFHQHFGRENLVTNNILAYGGDFQVMQTRAQDHVTLVFKNNVVYFDRGEVLGGNHLRRLMEGNWSRENIVFERNLYFDASGRPPTFLGRPLADWQAAGFERGSLVADPLFVDPEGGDFRLSPGSPAKEIGFEAIDLSDVGPRPERGRGAGSRGFARAAGQARPPVLRDTPRRHRATRASAKGPASRGTQESVRRRASRNGR